jgi:hypothetical protein
VVTLRLTWWENNDNLKAKPLEASLVEAGPTYASSLRMLDKKLDLGTGRLEYGRRGLLG